MKTSQIFAFVIIVGSFGFGGDMRGGTLDDNLSPPDSQLLRQTGKLFTVEFTPGDRHIHIRGAGKSLVEYTDGDLLVMGQAMSGASDRRDLHLVSDLGSIKGHAAYKIVEPLKPATVLEVQVQEKKNGKSEKFNFRLK